MAKGGNVKLIQYFLSASLICVSITWLKGGKLFAKSGAVGGRGLEVKRDLTALTGHRYGFLIAGS